MNRREALKGLSLSLGYVVAAPAVMGVLQSCSGEKKVWASMFLNENEKRTVVHLVDIILPSSDIPGGLDVNLPQFIDKMCNDVLILSDQELFRQGSTIFSNKFAARFNKEILNADRDEVLSLFSAYVDIPSGEMTKVLDDQKKKIDAIPESDQEDYLLYKYLITIRSLSLFGYYTSEKIGTEVLNFDPIPGVWKPCIPVSEVGNSWTI